MFTVGYFETSGCWSKNVTQIQGDGKYTFTLKFLNWNIIYI
jgi:hypothetical protein